MKSLSPISKTTPITSCFHCGEECEADHIRFEDHDFCCEGCKMVYQILRHHDLGKYYQLNQAAGATQKLGQKTTYTYLDDSTIRDQLLQFTNGKTSKVEFRLPQIHCSSCLWLLEHLYKIHPGVQRSTVNFLQKKATIIFSEEQISLRQLGELLASIGYPPEINFEDLSSTSKPKPSRRIYYQMGLAGFAFGNIMLLSFPEYLGLSSETEIAFARFFGYLNIILSLPVVFYSGQDYLKSAWLGLRQGYLNMDVPISLGILALFSRSLFEILTHTGAGYLDSLTGLVFFLLVGKWFQQKTFHQLSFERDYRSYFPIAVNIREADDQEQAIPLDQLQTGDTLIVRSNEIIPADAEIIKGKAVIDYSFVTGESVPVRHPIGEKIYAGGRQIEGTIELRVLRKVTQSYLTQLWNNDAFQKKSEQGAATQLADRVGRYFTVIILSIATITLLYWLPTDLSRAINAFTAVLIIACPCAVALSIPFTFGNVIRLLGRQGFYLKNIGVIEKLNRIRHIVFDKTGTITDPQALHLSWDGPPLSTIEKTWIKTLVNQSNHPLSRRIRQQLSDSKSVEVKYFEEHLGQGIEGVIADYTIRLGSTTYILSEEPGSGPSEVLVEIDGKYRGRFQFRHPFRQGFRDMIQGWRSQYRFSLISGDQDHARPALQDILGPEATLRFRQKPQDKLDYIQQLKQETNGNVMMLGDGLNDAGALQSSDLGIVIAEDTNNFTPACDAILDAKSFTALPRLMAFGQQSLKVVYFAYAIAAIYNVIGLSFAVRGALSPVIAAILMPLSSLTIVLLSLGLSSWLAYRMGLRKK